LTEWVRLSEVAVEVLRSPRRRTVSLEIHPDGVRVRVPAATPAAWVRSFVEDRQAWIAGKREQVASRPRPPQRCYETGERFPYLGVEHALRVETAPKGGVSLAGGELRVAVPGRVADRPSYVGRTLVTWYRQQAQSLLKGKCEAFGALVGRHPRSVAVRTYRRRWGSCDALGNIRFNWLLVSAPEAVIDYVVVHELCHLHHLDHSPRFWGEVERVLPDYRERRRWLRDRGGALGI
jgi:predicted metal-dependent hydrolase